MKINSSADLLIGMLLFAFAQILGFFQMNLRYIHPWWEDKGILTTLLFAIPVGGLFYYGWGHVMSGLNSSAWSARFIGFGISYLVFPFLTYFYLNESFFSFKTLSCFVLSLFIVLIQIYAE